MKVFHPSTNRRVIEKWLSNGEGEIYIFSPFFTEKGLEYIHRNTHNYLKINLLVRASFDDFISGALSVPALKSVLKLGWNVKRYEYLHAKAFFNDKEMLFGSVNLTGRGLGYPPIGNFELLGMTELTDKEIIKEFEMIWKQSTVISDDYLDEIAKDVEKFKADYNKRKKYIKKINNKFSNKKEFSLKHIVQSKSIRSFYERLVNGNTEDSIFYHDYNLLSAYQGISYEELLENFLTIGLVKKFLSYLGDGRFFGDLRKWLVENIDDVPTPSRDDFNIQLNKLYDLVVEATQGRYRRITPGAHSEKLEKINNT